MSTRGVHLKVLAVGESFAGGYFSEPGRGAFFIWVAYRKGSGKEWDRVELYIIDHGDHRPMEEMKAMVLKALQTRRIRLTETKMHSDGLFASGLVTITDQSDKQTFIWTATRESEREPWNPKHIGIDYLDYEPGEFLVSPTVLEKRIVGHLRRKPRKKS